VAHNGPENKRTAADANHFNFKRNHKLVGRGSWAYARGPLFLIDRFTKNLAFLPSFLYDATPKEHDLFFIF
jgi:hypothetical protein